MTRLIGPDDQYRMFLITTGANKGKAYAPPGTPVPLFADDQASIGADVRAMDGSTISGDPVPTVLIGDTYQAPLFKYPDGVAVVYTRVLGGPIIPLYARESDRFIEFQAGVTAAQAAASDAAADAADAAADASSSASAAATAATAASNSAGAVTTAQSAATAAATSASQAATSAAQSVAITVGLPAATGTDDTTAINIVLAASAGLRVAGRPGSAYKISAPLVLSSGTTLDMTGCTVTLLPGNAVNMVNNAAVAGTRRVLDAAITNGSATFTSATGTFTSGDVGKAITIQGAGAAGVPLTTTINAVTNSTTVTLAATAGTTVTGQYAAIGPRDSDITVTGGTWNRGANGPGGSINGHTMRFRHVDRLTVGPATLYATGGKYAVNPGDCTRIRVKDINLPDYSSDGVHLNGPCSQVSIERIFGNYMGDDLVSMTARDSVAGITDCAGDITDVVIDTAQTSAVNPALFHAVVKVVAGQTTDGSANYAVRRVSASHLIASDLTGTLVYVGDPSGGVFDDLNFDDVRSLGGSTKGCILLHGGTIGRVTASRLVPAAGDSYAVSVDVSVASLIVDGIQWTSTSGSPIGVNLTAGTLTYLALSNVRMVGAAGEAVRANSGTTLARLAMVNIYVDAVRTVSATAGSSVTSIEMANIVAVNNAYPLGVYQSTTVLKVANVTATGMTAWLWVQGSGQVTVRGATGLVGDADTYLGNVLLAARGSSIFTADPTLLSSGEETISRLFAQTSANTASGNLVLTYFTARRSGSTANVRTFTGSQAAATASLCRVGLFTVDSSGNLTLVAATANDVTLWNGTFAPYTRAWSAPYTMVAGQIYALGLLYVGTTTPRWICSLPVLGSEAALAPKLSGTVTGQSDLPALAGTITAGSVGSSSGIVAYAAIVP